MCGRIYDVKVRTRLHLGVTSEEGRLERSSILALLVVFIVHESFRQMLSGILGDIRAYMDRSRSRQTHSDKRNDGKDDIPPCPSNTPKNASVSRSGFDSSSFNMAACESSMARTKHTSDWVDCKRP